MTWQDVLATDADYERWVCEGQQEPTSAGWTTRTRVACRIMVIERGAQPVRLDSSEDTCGCEGGRYSSGAGKR